jgi:tRNA dimethylallyltransferase
MGRAQLLRAIEVALLTGKRLSALRATNARPARVRARYLVVDSGPALAKAIAGRVERMLCDGWEAEVKRLCANVPDDAPAWKATGYETVRDLVRGHVTRDQAVGRVVVETRQYAKRQRTWFRHQLPQADVTRLVAGTEDTLDAARKWWREEAA